LEHTSAIYQPRDLLGSGRGAASRAVIRRR